MTPEKLSQKATKVGLEEEKIQSGIENLHREGFILSYDSEKGRVYKRAYISFMVEQQVRRRRGTPLGNAYAQFWDALADVSRSLPTKTPYFRVLPVEATLKDELAGQHVEVDYALPDPREVLPIDIVSEMVKKEPLIGISDCYCRIATENRGGHCEYIKDTCFTFNELAQTLIETGLARQIDAEEATSILRRAEEAGLIHNLDNCQGELKAMCNCCPCCCPAVRGFMAGARNVDGASRFIVSYTDELCNECLTCVETCPVEAIEEIDSRPSIIYENCIGCGLCVTACPDHALSMVLREEQPRIPKTNDALWGQIRREAVVSLVKSKIPFLGSR
jgi:Pyruvate/2-oxoacid:ferredoxin oxidoreductase delta subunit